MSTPMAAYGNRTPEQLKVAELRDELRKRGVQIKGLKKELVERLEELLRDEEQQQLLQQQQQQEAQSEEAVGVTVGQRTEPGEAGDPEPVTPLLKQKLVDAEPEAGSVTEVVAEAVEQLPDAVAALENEAMAEQPNGDPEDVERVVSDAKKKEAPEAAAEEEEERAPQEENGLAEVVTAEPEAAVVEKQEILMEIQQPPASAEEVVADAEAQEAAAGEAIIRPVAEPIEEEEEEEAAAPEAVVEPASGPVIAALDEEEAEEEEEVVTPADEAVVVVTEVVTEETEVVVVTEEIKTTTTQFLVETPGEERDGEQEMEEEKEEEEEVVDKSVVMQIGSREEEAMEVIEEEDAIQTTAVAAEEEEKRVQEEEEVSVEEIREISEPDTEMKTETTVVVAETSAEEEVKYKAEPRQEAPIAEVYDEPRKVTDVKTMEIDTETTTKTKDVKTMEIDTGTTTQMKDVKTMEIDTRTTTQTKDVKTTEIDTETALRSKRKEGDGEARSQEPTKRQRRWNTGKIDIDVKAASPKLPMTESVKEETPAEVKETASSFAALPTVPVSSSTTPKSASGLERTAITRPTLSRSDASFNGEAQKTRVVPPSTKPPTTSLKIDKFLRPFTHKAVKELLANTGVVQAMWMDQIKTHCYVTYSTVEEAVATRNALYNLQWPPQGGRLLTAEFVESEEVKIRCDGEKAALSTVVPPRGPVPPPARETPAEHAVSAPPPTHPSSLPPVPTSGLPPPPPLPPPPRERPSMPNKQEMELQGPTLDDLFKKTRAKPHIYYLPLTEKDVAEKLAARRQASMIKPSVKT
ncbi:unnamed protein product [Sphagnum compactum]